MLCKGTEALEYIYYMIWFHNQIIFVFRILLSEHRKEQETLEQPESGRQCADGEEVAWLQISVNSCKSVHFDFVKFEQNHTLITGNLIMCT